MTTEKLTVLSCPVQFVSDLQSLLHYISLIELILTKVLSDAISEQLMCKIFYKFSAHYCGDDLFNVFFCFLNSTLGVSLRV